MTSLALCSAMRRIQRDIVELERSKMPSISAVPLENNIFEWHVNIKPLDGVYSGVCFHLIMKFPTTYPNKPPTIQICTPIRHPNIFNDFLCLSMLRPNTQNEPYEGWSSSYSITSILMQLQSFLFAEKIDQDGGFKTDAKLSNLDVVTSIQICKTFKCRVCGHSHSCPHPKVVESDVSLIKMCPLSNAVSVCGAGTSAQTTDTQWASAYASYPVHKLMNNNNDNVCVYYEANVSWIGSKWNRNNISGGLCRFGFGTKNANIVGTNSESFGYGGTGKWSYQNIYHDFGESFTKNDTICCGIDFNQKRIYFAKNGEILEPNRVLFIDERLWQQCLHPMVSLKNSRAEFNFGAPKKPCRYLLERGFKNFEELLFPKTNHDSNIYNDKVIDWLSQYIIDDIWLSIFESLQYEEIFQCKFVCKHFNVIINNFNVLQRNEVYCFFSKQRLNHSNNTVLGIGLNINIPTIGHQPVIKSQMDYLSLNAWNKGCRIGVWGEALTHFLPLVLNRKHCEYAHDYIIAYLTEIESFMTSKRRRNSILDERLRLVDIVVTMMNQLVVQFVMDNNYNKTSNVEMMLCEKVVLGYAQFHHLLLYLVHNINKKHNNFVTIYCNQLVENFLNPNINGSHKTFVPDLGKFLIYCMLSKYKWCDIVKIFVYEVMARNILWIIKDNPSLNNTDARMVDRAQVCLKSTLISRRLVMFQSWFMINNKMCTLKEYNHRLGKPTKQLQNDIKIKTKHILASNTWSDYMSQLNVSLENNDFNGLLTFAVYVSFQNGYHRCHNANTYIVPVIPPKLLYIGTEKSVEDNNNRVMDVDRSVNNCNSSNDNRRNRDRERGYSDRYGSRSRHRYYGQQQHPHESSYDSRSRSRSRSRNHNGNGYYRY